ncbi:MAG: ABC transporter transmembrane domain-containing protein [Pseudomonadales bacterium]|nr:ABC transporter transmembrane domain-containing protein [Pseudomonadales bacterium]
MYSIRVHTAAFRSVVVGRLRWCFYLDTAIHQNMTEQLTQNPDPKPGIRTLKSLLVFLKPYKVKVVIATTALLITAGLMLSLGQGMRLLVDDGFATGSPEMLNHSIFIFLGLVVCLSIGTFIRFFYVSWIGERISNDIRISVFNHLLQLHPSFFETNDGAEIQSRITTDTTLLQTVIGSSFSIAVRNVIMFFGGITLLLITNPKLTGIVLGTMPLILAPVLFFGRRVRRLARSSQDKIADIGVYVAETLTNIKTVHAFSHQRIDQDNFLQVTQNAFRVAVYRIRQRAWLMALVMMLIFGAIGFMFWVGGHDVLAGRITGGELVAFVFYAMMVAASLGAISEVYGDLQRAAGATERLLELLATESLLIEPNQIAQIPETGGSEIHIEQLSFNYPSRPNAKAIDKLELKIEKGAQLAIVGPSGAGKSTLFDLILRFYDPQKGAIRINGVDIREMKLQQLRERIAVVPQQPSLFSTNAWDNIRYSKPDASDEEVIAAAKAAYAHDFLEALPDGYDSFLGQGGIRLSGGQRQRIAIARAILKDPQILLLDEATSALDAESEHVVQKALDHLMKNRTTLVIAHRLATVVHAQSIAVLDDGKLVEIGQHQQLLQSCPLYARLAALQFREPDAIVEGRVEGAVEQVELV